MNQLKLLICGDREWNVLHKITDVIESYSPDLIIHGAAKGADLLAEAAAKVLEIDYIGVPAKWHTGTGPRKAQGHIRNNRMFKLYEPDVVIGFHENIEASKGTKYMLNISVKAGKPTFLHDGEGLTRITEVIK